MRKTFLKTLVATAVVGTTLAISSVVAFAGTYILNAGDVSTGTYKESFTAGTDNYFTVTASDSASVAVDSSSKTATLNGVSTSFTKRIKTGGAGTADARSIKFTTTGPVEIEIAAISSNTSDTRTVNIVDTSDDSTVGTLSIKELGTYTKSLTSAGTYYIATASGGLNVYGVCVKDVDKVEYLPTEETQTSSASTLYADSTTNLTNGSTCASGVSTTGVTSNSARISLGGDVNSNGTTSADWGYISFNASGTFTVAINMASSGTKERTLYVGTSSDNGKTFTDVAEATLVSGTMTLDVVDGADTTYYIYAKNADNVRILKVDLITGDYVVATTPAVTLGDATVADGKLTLTATISDFTKSAFEVQKITLNAATSKDTESAAVWTPINITKLADNGDGTVSFTVRANEPAKKSKFQAVVEYKGVADVTSSVSDKAVSNAVTYTVAE